MAQARSIVMRVLSVAVLVGIYAAYGWSQRFDEIPYRGQTYRLARMYWDWEAYKADPTLAADQIGAVQKAVESDAITPTYTRRSDMITGMFNVKFPGFGMTCFGERAQADGSLLAGYACEVPMADRERVVVYRGRNDTWTLVDDFVSPGTGAICRVDDVDGKLVYSRDDGKVVVTRESRGR